MTPLARPRPLRLADGTHAGSVTHSCVITHTFGPITERLSLYAWPLAGPDAILGLPWLQLHNPAIDWSKGTMSVKGQVVSAARPTDDATTSISLIDSEPLTITPTPSPGEAARHAAKIPKRKRQWEKRERKRQQAAHSPLPQQLAIKPRTAAATDKEDKGVAGRTRKGAKRVRQNERRWRTRQVETFAAITPATAEDPPLQAAEETPGIPRDPDGPPEVLLLNAVNFLFMARQKDVHVQKITQGSLYALTNDTAPDLATAEDEIGGLSPAVLRSILLGGDDTRELPPRVAAFKGWIDQAPWLRAITEEDIEKFMDGKPPPDLAEIHQRLPTGYHDLIDAFTPSEAETLPPHRPFDHKIELLPGQTPPNSRVRPMSQAELRVIRKYLDEHLAKGFIRPSSSSAAAPVLLARKPGGGIRICVDYRGLNNVTVKNRYPIPLIRETLDALAHAKFYTKLDITAAFNRLRIAPGDEWKTAFITRFGLFECLVANFGMTGAPSSFQHYINHTLFDLLDKYVTAYLDDVLIYSESRSEHRRHVREVITRLRDAGLTIDIRKCEFETKSTKYLGLIISDKGVGMDPDKVAAVTSWEPPETLKDLQRFVGFSNFYRRFIKGFSKIALPLTSRMSREKWRPFDTEATKAFEDLKSAFVSAPVLSYYRPDRSTVVEVDASDWAAGGVLSQYNDEGVLHPVAYFSAKHSPAECNYEIYDKELLAIVKAFEEWRPELQGLEDPVEVLTDHKSLEHFTTTKLLNQRQVRWSEFLSDFRYQITYRAGKHATVPDALSRKTEDAPTSTTDLTDERISNRQRILLPPDRWKQTDGGPAHLRALDVSQPVDAHIARGYTESNTARAVITALQNPETRRFPRAVAHTVRAAMADCKLVNGQVFVNDRLFVPEEGDARLQVLHRTHSGTPAGHPGRFKTYDLLRRTYYWPGMSRDAEQFVKGCHMCARTKSSRHSPPGFLKPLPVPVKPWADISVDYVGPLPECVRDGVTYEHCLVVVDRLTKMRHFVPVPKTDAPALAAAFVTNIYKLHGTPDTIISDRGSQFVSTFWREFSRRLGISLHHSTAFHPETDGQTERINGVMEQYLRTYCGHYQDDWVDWLPLAEFASNNHTSETTGLSPFFANYGWHPRMGSEPNRPPDLAVTPQLRREFMSATAVEERIRRVVDHATAFMGEAQQRYAATSDVHRSDAPTYSIGDNVWVNTLNIKSGRPSEKLSDKWMGPYRVTKVYPRAVAVSLPESMRIFPVFHVALVKPASKPFPGQSAANEEFDAKAEGAIVTNLERAEDDPEEVEWVFEKILNSRVKNGALEYRIKWGKPWAPSWQPAADVEGCDSDITDFHTKFPNKPGPAGHLDRPTGPQTDRRRSTRRH